MDRIILKVFFKHKTARAKFEAKVFPNHKQIKGLSAMSSLKDLYLFYIDEQGGLYNTLVDDSSLWSIEFYGGDDFLKQAKKDFKKWNFAFNRGYRRAGLKFKMVID